MSDQPPAERERDGETLRTRCGGGRLARCVLVLLTIGAVVLGADEPRAPIAAPEGSPAAPLPAIPRPPLEGLESAVAEQIRGIEDHVEGLLAEPEIVATPESRALAGEAVGELGRVYQAYGFGESAAQAFASAVMLTGGEFRWLYHHGVVRQDLGELETAVALLIHAGELRPEAVEVRVRLGEVLLELGRTEEAADAFARAVEIDGASAAAWAGLGQVALSERRWADAVEAFEKALELVPEATRLHYPLGLAWRGLGEAEKAVEHLSVRGEVGVRPPDPLIAGLDELKQGERVYVLRGKLAYRSGRLDEAVAAYREALEHRPDSITARVDLAAALTAVGRSEEAVELLEAVVVDAPDNATGWYNLGLLREHSGRLDAAIEALREAFALAPEDAEVMAALGRTLAAGGRTLEALGVLADARGVDPANEELWMGPARILTDQGRWSEVRRLLEEASAELPDSGRIASSLARLLAASPDAELRDAGRALDLARRVHEARPGSFEAETIALALGELGDCEEAWKWQVRALASAYRDEDDARAEALRSALDRYREPPCRPPVAPRDGK